MFTKINYEKYKKHISNVKDRFCVNYDALFTVICDIPCKVNWLVNSSDCLMLPDNYMFPKNKKYEKTLQQIVIALKNKRHTFIWGTSGCGKDSFVHAYCAMTKTPSEIFQIRPGEDIQSWFFLRDFNKEGTFFTDGLLLKMIRDGYTLSDGTKIPYMILISDFDRAEKSQAESLRLILDSIKGRIKGPHGITYSIFPGTCFVFTGNSPGSGDASGKYLSSNPIDMSLFDRIERKFKMGTMPWEDEKIILQQCFPLVFSECKNIQTDLRNAVSKIRSAIDNEQFFADFSIRSLKGWLGHAQDMLKETGETTNLLARSIRVWTDSLPDEETRLKILRLLESDLAGINSTNL